MHLLNITFKADASRILWKGYEPLTGLLDTSWQLKIEQKLFFEKKKKKGGGRFFIFIFLLQSYKVKEH